MDKRRYFIGFVKEQPMSFAPIGDVMQRMYADMPELHEVTFTEWFVFNRESVLEYNAFPPHIPNEGYYWREMHN